MSPRGKCAHTTRAVMITSRCRGFTRHRMGANYGCMGRVCSLKSSKSAPALISREKQAGGQQFCAGVAPFVHGQCGTAMDGRAGRARTDIQLMPGPRGAIACAGVQAGSPVAARPGSRSHLRAPVQLTKKHAFTTQAVEHGARQSSHRRRHRGRPHFFTSCTMSSSARTWLSPTLCGLCFTEAPHTRA